MARTRLSPRHFFSLIITYPPQLEIVYYIFMKTQESYNAECNWGCYRQTIMSSKFLIFGLTSPIMSMKTISFSSLHIAVKQ